MMKPILFNTDMVRGILNETKSVTRRVVKPQPKTKLFPMPIGVCWDGYFAEKDSPCMVKPPYFPGDALYVRETWAAWSRTEGIAPTIHYKADHENLPGVKWRPSIHMPRQAARIFLRVMDVWVERLQDISERDLNRDFCFNPDAVNAVGKDAVARPFWDSTIKPADRLIYGWDANPQVWVIDFEQITKEEAIKFDRI